MASKFMAFEGVASTSSASMENYNDAESERIEMNSSQHPNYQTNQSHENTEQPNPYGADDEENDLTDDLEEKTDTNVGYRKFIYNNSEQFKCICGGLFVLMGSGIHIVWGIYRVFYFRKCDSRSYVGMMILSWYIGAIIGCCCAAYAIAKYRKRTIYFVGAALLIKSGLFLMFSSDDANFFLLMSRIFGGVSQGLVYVTVVVHASDNATKEFREFLMLIVGAVLNYSILLSVLGFFHTEGLISTGLLNGLGLLTFGVCTIMISAKHSTETVPFILQNDGSELDALQVVGKLKKKSVSARSVHHDFLIMKNLVQDEIELYGAPEFRKVLLPENRRSLIFCLYGRLCSILSFNLPLIVMILLFLRQWIDGSFEAHGNVVTYSCPADNLSAMKVTFERPKSSDDEIAINAPLKRTKRHENEDEIKKPASVGAETEKHHESEKPKESQKEPEKVEKVLEEIVSEKDGKKVVEIEEKKIVDGKTVEDVIIEEEKDIATNSKGGKKSEEKPSTKKANEHDKVSNDKKPEGSAKHEEHNHKGKIDTEKPTSNEANQKNGKSDGKKTNKSENHHQKHNEKGTKVSEKEATNTKKEETTSKESSGKTPEKEDNSVAKIATPTIFGHLIVFLHRRELTLVLLAWFVFGTITAAVLYIFDLKRFIYYISCVVSSALAITWLTHKFLSLTFIFHFCLMVYFNYVTIPIDVFGHCMLAEAFPVTLKAHSVAVVAIVEHFVHIMLITLYLTDWLHDSIMLFMCVVAFISHEIARNLPQKTNLPAAQAREQYQNVDLMLFNEPKTGYNQQEFI